jgi:poly(A) polymerase
MALSRERIRDELLKLLVAPQAVAVTRLMVERGILRPVLPEIGAAGVQRLAALAAREATPDALRRLVALLPNPDAVEAVGARLKLSNLERKRIASAARPRGAEPARALGYRLGIAGATDRLLLAGEAADALDGWTPPVLPVTGGALVARGLHKGPVVAATLKRIEDRWIAEGFPADVDAIVAEAVAQALCADSSA